VHSYEQIQASPSAARPASHRSQLAFISSATPAWCQVGTLRTMQRRVVLYELNEVPWDIVDLYVGARPASNLASLLGRAMCLTTINEDEVPFQPWRTWPTFHRSLYTDDHRSLDLGQDPSTFEGVDLWTVADDAGLRVGVFGAMQSWPPRRFRSGGFHVPDTFARTPATYPPSLSRFQAFNLHMTRENGFSPDAPLRLGQVAAAGLDMAAKGLTPWSAAVMASHLVRERVDPRYKARRSIMQVLPTFDLYWRLHRRTRPHLSVFFTNHVAGMMHRYWGDAVPGYADEQPYRPDDVYRRFVVDAMNLFDHQLGRLLRHLEAHPETVVVVASSMGQGPIPYAGDMDETYVLRDTDRFAAALGLDGAETGLAMYPRVCLQLPDAAAAAAAVGPITSVVSPLGRMFDDVNVHGTTVSFEIDYRFAASALPSEVTWEPAGRAPTAGRIGDLGIVTDRRTGGANTAYHVPEGIFIAAGDGLPADPSREKVSVLDAAPSVLDLLGVAPHPSMQGRPTIFR
jgi:hypothetical protein